MSTVASSNASIGIARPSPRKCSDRLLCCIRSRRPCAACLPQTVSPPARTCRPGHRCTQALAGDPALAHPGEIAAGRGRYTLAHWLGLVRFLDNGALELDTNPVENEIPPIALTRKNALFAGNEIGAENWAMLASLVATCKLSDVNPIDYLADTLRAILDGHPRSRIENLMPWRYAQQPSSLTA